MARKKHWYTRRTRNDAPGYIEDQAMDKAGAYASGWNDAVQAYLDETAEIIRREQARR